MFVIEKSLDSRK